MVEGRPQKIAFTLGKKDLEVLKAFSEKKPANSEKLISNGRMLSGRWTGGAAMAFWRDGKVVFNDLGSKIVQSVQQKLKRDYLAPAQVSRVARSKSSSSPMWKTEKSNRVTGEPLISSTMLGKFRLRIHNLGDHWDIELDCAGTISTKRGQIHTIDVVQAFALKYAIRVFQTAIKAAGG